MKHRSVHAVSLSYCPCGLQSAGVGTQVLVSYIIITPLQTDANRRTNWWEGNLTFDPFLLEASPVSSPCLTLPEVNKLSSDSRFSDNREMTNSTQTFQHIFTYFFCLIWKCFFVSFIQPSNKLIDSLELQVEHFAVLLFCLWSDRGEAADSLQQQLADDRRGFTLY